MSSYIVKIPETITGPAVVVDMGSWIGCGIDAIVSAAVQVLNDAITDESASPWSVLGNALGIRRSLFPWLQRRAEAIGRPLSLDMLDSQLVEEYIADLKATSSYLAAQNAYFSAAFVFRNLSGLGLVGSADVLLPRNAFPGAQSTGTPTSPYTAFERKAIFRALAADYQQIVEGRWGQTPEQQPQAIVVCLFFLAFLTGLNLTPLLELSRNSLEPHPVKAGGFLLVTYKRRGNKIVTVPLKTLPIIRNPRFDVPEVFATVLRLTEPLIDAAKPKFRNCLFLRYRKKRGRTTVTTLHAGIVVHAASRLSRRYGLESETGGVLEIGTRRIRATLGARVSELSNGDPLVVASVLGNLPSTAGIHYMSPDLDAPASFQTAVEVFVTRLQGEQPSTVVSTPVGGCTDPLRGRFAPKDGTTYCQRWLNCFRCPNQCLVGEEASLWRAYSFYWVLQARYQALQRSAASGLVRFAMHVMDTVLIDTYGDKARKARDRARYDPHPFWRAVSDNQLLDLVVPDAST